MENNNLENTEFRKLVIGENENKYRNIDDLKSKFEIENAWGLYSSVDIYKCSPEIIRNAEEIKRYVIKLCDLIDMQRHGPCFVENFGEDERVAGYSMFQLIETSNISGHFANQTNASYIDVFSCKFYNPWKVAEFTRNFFKADYYKLNIALRKEK